MGKDLHVGNLPKTLTSEDLAAKFGRFGTVETAKISRDAASGASQGFGRVCMSSATEAQAAIAYLNLTQQFGLTMVVSLTRRGGDSL